MKTLLLITVLSFSFSASARNCKTKVTFRSNSKVNPSVYKCDDGSISYTQIKSKFVPSTTGQVLRSLTGSRFIPAGRTESYCGVTSAVNVFNAYCKEYYLNPSSIAKRYFDDINPGLRYDTLLNGLNDLFDNNSSCLRGHWRKTHPKSAFDFIRSIYYKVKRGKGYWKNPKTNKIISPVIVLLNRTPKTTSLHYVTVVDINGFNPSNRNSIYSDKCLVSVNEWGDQRKFKCSKFAQESRQVNDPWQLRWMHDYYLFSFE